jgi:PhnB protein
MMKAAAYLHFKDKAEEAIETYQSIFEAKVINQYKFEEGMTENPDLLGKIFHAELKIGDLNLFLCDTDQNASFESIKFVLEIRDEDQAHALFSKLSTHGKIIQNFTKMPYGPTIGEAIDKFGIKWDIVIC